MIIVFTLENGDVAYRCPVCDKAETVSLALSSSVFWDIYNGRALLSLLGHYEDKHTP